MISSRPVRILDKLPIGEEPTVPFVGAEAVTIKRDQFGVWISINNETGPLPFRGSPGRDRAGFAGLVIGRIGFAGLEPSSRRLRDGAPVGHLDLLV
jgi:hypothetical protein